MQPKTLLPILLGGAVGAGGILQGLHWRNAATEANSEELRGQITALENEIETLRTENQSLRSLVQGGGEVQVSPEIEQFVESAIGLDFRSSPVVHRIAFEELRDRVVASIESRFPPNSLDHRQQAWRAMGLLAPDDLYAPQLAATRSLGARSWFDDQSGEGWVTDRFEPSSIPDQAALLRVLVRILLHQHYPPRPGYPGDDADRTREAIHHGAALAIENRYLARQALGVGFTGSQNRSNDAGDLLASLPVFIQGLATFPSRSGMPRAEKWLEQSKLKEILHSPPPFSAALFHENFGEATLPPLPPSSATVVLDESAGMLGLRLWLATLDPENPDALSPADAWRGDRYRLSARSDTALDLVWQIQLATPEAANAISTTALAMAGMLAEAETDPALGETTTSPDGRRLLVEMPDPNSVRFTHLAPE